MNHLGEDLYFSKDKLILRLPHFQDNYSKSITLTLHILNEEALEKFAEMSQHSKIKIHYEFRT